MDDDKKTVESLEQVFAAGDAWLRNHGLVTGIAHNAIVANLYVNFPKVRYLEYFLPEDGSRRKVWVILYVPFWKLVFTNRDAEVDKIIEFLKEYLQGYDIKVELKRYKKGVEKSDAIPTNAVDHVAAPVELHEQPTVPESPAGTSQDAGNDPERLIPPASEPGDVPPVPDSSGA